MASHHHWALPAEPYPPKLDVNIIGITVTVWSHPGGVKSQPLYFKHEDKGAHFQTVFAGRDSKSSTRSFTGEVMEIVVSGVRKQQKKDVQPLTTFTPLWRGWECYVFCFRKLRKSSNGKVWGRVFLELLNHPTSTREEASWQLNSLHSSGFRLSTRS